MSNHKLDLTLTIRSHPAVFQRDALLAAPRAFAVIAVQDTDTEPTAAAPIPPLELLALVEDADELQGLAVALSVIADGLAQMTGTDAKITTTSTTILEG